MPTHHPSVIATKIISLGRRLLLIYCMQMSRLETYSKQSVGKEVSQLYIFT